MDPVTRAAAARIERGHHCPCLAVRGKTGKPSVPNLHEEAQDLQTPGWEHAQRLVRTTADAASTIFEPSAHLQPDEMVGLITLPSEIGDLTSVREMRLYGSHLRRLPPEIGRMAALQDLDIYTSYSLHWLPYEVTRCANLVSTRMSTRALYGNSKTRLPFPRLSRPIEAFLPSTCSVCDRAFGDVTPQLHWITLRVGTDNAPLLVHSCSRKCTLSLPVPPDGYHPQPHKGGGGVGMPSD